MRTLVLFWILLFMVMGLGGIENRLSEIRDVLKTSQRQ
jgi:hypothetical protein